MLNRVQHDEVVVASPWTPKKCVTLNSFQGLVFTFTSP